MLVKSYRSALVAMGISLSVVGGLAFGALAQSMSDPGGADRSVE